MFLNMTLREGRPGRKDGDGGGQRGRTMRKGSRKGLEAVGRQRLTPRSCGPYPARAGGVGAA